MTTEELTRPVSEHRPLARVGAVDMFRGLVVAGVVLNHAVDGTVAAGLLDVDSGMSQLNQALYIFRMPALAFLIGVFVPRAVSKLGTRGYLVRRATLLLYLYVVWFVIQGTVEVLGSGLKNRPIGPEQLLTVWSPIGHLWFLPFAVVAAGVLAVTRPWSGSVYHRVAVLTGLAVLSVLAWTWNPAVAGLRGLSLLFFAAVGAVVGLPRLSRALAAPLSRWAATGAVALTTFGLLLPLDLVPGTKHLSAGLDQKALSFVAAGAGIVALLAVTVALARVSVLERLLGSIGRRTMPIYLAHLVVVGVVRIALQQAGVDSWGLVVVAAAGLGLAVPLVMERVAKRHAYASWLFELPQRPSALRRAGSVSASQARPPQLS